MPVPAPSPSSRSPQPKRVRKSPDERRREILDAAVRLISERGYNGISIQDVADEVGVTKQGVLRYIGSKDNLLAMVYRDNYNVTGNIEEFMASGLPGSEPGDLRFPAYLRFLVAFNERRRMLVQLFSMLQVESFNPSHPLHDEFAGRQDEIWRYYSRFDWRIPPAVGEWDASMRPVVRRAMEIMDGVQLRWLREPAIGLADEWSDLEPMIFPSPLWDGYR
ncbi:TetR/AcrR family transcriptional regulator [Bifidobacterium samirii]|uniref:AcrR family transcriptional regulator n=1 Tax=Bifidobacterium samirii TaxID=2306974 RepID=A0A430FWR2_9BIFI|nr:TetR/AcrR family transcriptional regulator [Bifidobacterium samirii]RSX58734.1 AcrR family transcriptional regulator [Bifidobacterium samirii]